MKIANLALLPLFVLQIAGVAPDTFIRASSNDELQSWIEEQRTRGLWSHEALTEIEEALVSLEAFDDISNGKSRTDEDGFSHAFLRIIDGMEVRTLLQFAQMTRTYEMRTIYENAYSDGGMIHLLETPYPKDGDREKYLAQFRNREHLVIDAKEAVANNVEKIEELEDYYKKDNQAAHTTSASAPR